MNPNYWAFLNRVGKRCLSARLDIKKIIIIRVNTHYNPQYIVLLSYHSSSSPKEK